jgi:transposase
MTRREGMGACIAAVEGATTKAVFEAYVEEALAPSLRPGQVMVMDNLSSHKGQRVRELIEGRGCELLYLAPYSPDLTTPSSGPWQSLRPRCAGHRPGPLGR